MWKAVIVPDTHWLAGRKLHWSYRLVKEFIEAEAPDVIIHLGDALDLNYLSKFDERSPLHLEGKRYSEDIALLEEELKFYKDNAERVVLLEGNHDERVRRVIEQDPRWEGLIEYESLLDFKALDVEYYPLTKQPVKVGKLHICHGWWASQYAAKKHLEQWFGNIVFGHTHRRHYFSKVAPGMNTEIASWGLGCLTDRNPEYLKGMPAGWQHDFAVVYFEPRGDFHFYRIPIVNKKFVWEGRLWKG